MVVLVHHDTKPPRDGKADDRPRAQRASGGGLLSISDAPMHFERISADTTLLVPNLWKFSEDPPAMKVRFAAGAGWAASAALTLSLTRFWNRSVSASRRDSLSE